METCGGGRRGVELARGLRRTTTRSEAILWNALRGRQVGGVKFRRQQRIGPFVVDFYCPERRLVIEVDGEVHDFRVEADAKRQRYLEEQGLSVMRVSAEDVERWLPIVLERIARVVGAGVAPARAQ